MKEGIKTEILETFKPLIHILAWKLLIGTRDSKKYGVNNYHILPY
jgi:hypothetical protein